MARRPLNKRYRLMLRWGVPCLGAAIALGWVVAMGGVRADPAAPNADGSIDGLTDILDRTATADMVRFALEDVTDEAGIDFRHFPATRRSLLPEDMGSGAAWGDYDDDGDPDLFLVNFACGIRDPLHAADDDGRCALYRNDGGVFTNASRESGADPRIRGLGAAWGDADGDGDLDLAVTAYGTNLLLRNDGGVFTDVAAAAGVDDDGFGAGCAWCDYDNDGDLDLYVCNYVRFEDRPEDADRTTRQYGSEIPYTINPSSYPPAPNRLYRNEGDGTFTDVAEIAGVANASGRSLGAAWFDYDLDGLVDLYVANDVSANGVFRNMGDGTFADIGASSLAADYRGAMGMAVGDLEADGDLDLFVTHWIAQENALFENGLSNGWTNDDGSPRLVFMDTAETMGLGYISLKTVGWSTAFTDLDNDGHLDLWVVNGNTLEIADDHARLQPQRTMLFWHRPGAGFYEIGEHACPDLAAPFVGRGGAAADYDGDGRVDLVVMEHGGRARLLRNTTDNDHRWLGVRLRRDGANARGLGARVAVRAGGRVQLGQVGADGSYLSQHDTTLHFGLGGAAAVDEIVVTWPDGDETRLGPVEANRVVVVERAPEA